MICKISAKFVCDFSEMKRDLARLNQYHAEKNSETRYMQLSQIESLSKTKQYVVLPSAAHRMVATQAGGSWAVGSWAVGSATVGSAANGSVAGGSDTGGSDAGDLGAGLFHSLRGAHRLHSGGSLGRRRRHSRRCRRDHE